MGYVREKSRLPLLICYVILLEGSPALFQLLLICCVILILVRNLVLYLGEKKVPSFCESMQ